MMRAIQLHFLFAKGYWFITSLFSLISYLIFANGGLSTLTILIWFKLVTSGIALAVHKNRKAKEVFFYLNNGINRGALFFNAVMVDLGIWWLGLLCHIKLI